MGYYVLDHNYVKLINSWGSNESIIEKITERVVSLGQEAKTCDCFDAKSYYFFNKWLLPVKVIIHM